MSKSKEINDDENVNIDEIFSEIGEFGKKLLIKKKRRKIEIKRVKIFF
jgi:hypothetical protein